jgi:hypothetical protein
MFENYEEYSASRRRQLEEEGYSLWVFLHDAIGCEARHIDLDGLAVPPGEDFWSVFYPPLSGECGCYVIGARHAAGVRRLGGYPEKVIPEWACRKIADFQQGG